ncbi:hypothetical protein [Thiocystis violascens]|nr:hypothetical protein [Thiocystis violascens]
MRFDPVDYGSFSTSYANFPSYPDRFFVNDLLYYQALLEIDVFALPEADSYLLELSPVSQPQGVGLTDTVRIIRYDGDGVVTKSDLDANSYAGFLSISAFGSYSYFDLTYFVNIYKGSGVQFLGLKVEDSTSNFTGVEFKAPVIVAEGVSAVPNPSTLTLFGSGVLILLGFSGFAATRKGDR